MTATAIPGTTPGRRPAHRDVNVLRWLIAYTASMLGDSVYFLALGFAAAKVASPAEVGMVMAAGSLPRVLLMLGGGVVADRFGPRRVVISSDAARCVLILGAAAVLALASPGLWLLVAVAVVFGVVDALFMPAVGALPPRIVAADELARLQGMRALAIRTSTVIGPPIGGVAMGLGGATAAFALAGGLFAVSVPLLVMTVMAPTAPAAARVGATGGATGSATGSATDHDAAERPSAWRQLVDGLTYVRRHPVVGPLVVSGAICELGMVGPLNVGMILLSQDRGWGSSGYGWIIGAFGVGAAASAVVLTVRGRLPRAGAVQIGTTLAGSVALGLIAVGHSLALAVVVSVFTGLFCGVCGSLTAGLIQSAGDPGYLGRITSVMSLASFGLAPLVYPLFGAAVGAWGPTPVFLVSAAFGALGGVVGLLTPAVRRAELPGRGGRAARQPGPRQEEQLAMPAAEERSYADA